MTPRMKRPMNTSPNAMTVKEVMKSPLLHSIIVDADIEIFQGGEEWVDIDTSDNPVVDGVLNHQWIGGELISAITTAGLKYGENVKKFYQKLLANFREFTTTDKWKLLHGMKSLPPADIGDISIPCQIRVCYFDIDENTIVYTVRSPGDKENKRIAARNIANIVNRANTITEHTTKERIVKSDREIVTVNGVDYVTKHLAGVISRTPDNKMYFDTLLIKVQ